MQLLTPQAVKDLRGGEQVREALRIKETQEAIKKLNVNLANAEADFAFALARHNKEWAKQEKEHSQRLGEMKKEIEILEAKRSEALIPVNILRKEAEELMQLAKKSLEKNQTKESELEDIHIHLEDLLDDAGARKIDLLEFEKRLEARERGIEQQAEQSKSGAEKLSKAMQDFQVYMATEESKLIANRKELELLKINLEAKSEKNRREFESLDKERKILEDQRATLERAFARLKK